VIKRFAAFLVLFSFMFVAIVHACSGLDGMTMASLHNTSENPMMGGEPCGKTKPNHNNVCESVRYRMLSVQAEPAQNGLTFLQSTLPNTISAADLIPLGALLAAPPGAAVIDSFPRHSLRFSHIVLRI
jgi:hypothetical protein